MSKTRKQYLWLPYLSYIKSENKKIQFVYKGGKEELNWKDIHSIMIYGSCIDLPIQFLEKCAFYKIPVVFHRRNITKAVFIASTLTQDRDNLLTKQILYRENIKKRSHITKKLLQGKFKSMRWLLPINRDLLFRKTNIKEMINIEAWHARRYWQEYYKLLGLNGERRDKNHNIASMALDAVSKFVSGIFLRWILYHNLSPFHGFLHKPTDYPALVYDLMEPYRGYFDKVVFEVLRESKRENLTTKGIIGKAIKRLKKFLNTKVYVHSTRQIADFNEVIHGEVLALRSYLLSEAKRMIIPQPDKPKGGRPIKAGFKLYGHQAGKTDFWGQVRKIANQFDNQYAMSLK